MSTLQDLRTGNFDPTEAIQTLAAALLELSAKVEKLEDQLTTTETAAGAVAPAKAPAKRPSKAA